MVQAALETLVSALVPPARNDPSLRRDIHAHANDILSSHIGQARQDVGNVADSIKRHLLQSSPSGVPALRFSNLLSRLLDQPVLSRKDASLQFLLSLAGSLKPRPGSIPLPSLPPPQLPQRSPTPSALPDVPLQPGTQRSKSKADIIREFRIKNGRPHLPEHLLLRDTLYLLQGISGKYVSFSSSKEVEPVTQLIFKEDPKYAISTPYKTLIHHLAEVGHLYIRVHAFVREREGKAGVGMIEQSLCHHLQIQLTEYYRLIAMLESHMTGRHRDADDQSKAESWKDDSGLTLKRLDVWIQDWRLRMRMMSVCVEGARGTHGGALVNLIRSYADNGDPFIRKFTDQLLEEVSKPFFAILHKWLFSGELNDPFSEFFVAINSELAQVQYLPQPSANNQLTGDGGFGLPAEGEDGHNEREGGLKLWESKYQFQEDMLPLFVGKVFGRKIFSTGKSLNFIRYNCHDSDWAVTRERLKETTGPLKYSDIAGLERSIDAAYQIASRRLFDVFFEKYGLLDHLQALKNYLLLGRGDFIDQLMEALAPSLARPANMLYRHNLTATLETAISHSSAQNDSPDVLRRLDARMLEYSHGEIGWDVFTLEYKLDAPIDTVLDPEAMVKYLKLFNHLWKIKRVESTLSQGWMRIAGGARAFLRIPDLKYDWHQIRIVMAEMIHFIRQMEAYCQLEVIECSWKILLDFVQQKEGDLDALIQAHRAFLDRMVKKVFLLTPKLGREENILNQVRDALAIIVQFREAMDDFYHYSLSESSRLDAERDEQRGVYTTITQRQERGHTSPPEILYRIRDYSSAFSDKVQAIVLGLQTHPDLDCRFLGIRLSFSEFYKTKKDSIPKSG